MFCFVFDFKAPEANNRSAAISFVVDLTSSDKDHIPVDVNDGMHRWVKFRATETSGIGSPAFGDGIAVCIK